MGKQLLQLSIKSLKRRWREITRACITTFLAVFFITGVLLFQDNMYQWQRAANKERFGDWFVMETNTTVPNPAIVEHPLLDGYTVAESAMKLYDAKWQSYNLYVGYMSPEFLEQSYIDVEVGRMPQSDDEIAMDWNTLLKMGYSSELGQTVTIHYYSDNNELDKSKRTSENYVLVGILESYTDIWKKGNYLPGMLVTKERYDAFNNNGQNFFIHKLSDDVKTDDYKLIFDNIVENSKSSPRYNDYLYDYKPWGTDSVYNYMYIVVMIIGIAAITYQLITYKNSRKNAYRIMRGIGAENKQITMITLMENLLILVISGLVGILFAAFIGKVICVFIESNMGIIFYRVKWEILLKGFLSIVIAVVVEQLVGRLLLLKDILVPVKKVAVLSESPAIIKVEKRLNRHNFTRQVSFRLTKTNGVKVNVGIRILSLGVCAIILFCGLKIQDAYEQYIYNDSREDLVGYYVNGLKLPTHIPGYFEFERIDGLTLAESWRESDAEKQEALRYSSVMIDLLKLPTQDEKRRLIYNDLEEQAYISLGGGKYAQRYFFSVYESKYAKNADTHILEGIPDRVVNTIEGVAGVSEVTYSTQETQRAWSWDGMSLKNMAATRLLISPNGEALPPYCDTYMFVTEYHNPTEELYRRLSKYIDADMEDYEAFAKGEQILVLVNTNAEDKYDESISAGINIDYHYYGAKVYNASDYPYYEFMNKKGVMEDYRELIKKTVYREEMFGACASPKVAGVVYLTDEIKADLKDLVVNYGYYTAIASTELGNTLCDNQNKLVEEYLGEELPDEARCEMKYNRIAVKYDLSASFSATQNILANYCKENNILISSIAEEKEIFRTELINSILRYGITLIAVMVINVLISAIITMNRLEARRSRVQLLLRSGADRSRVQHIFMIEAVRESLWCIFTMPIVLPVQYLLCTRATKETKSKKHFKIIMAGVGIVLCVVICVSVVALAMKSKNEEAIAETATNKDDVYTGDTIEEFEENGEKFYRESTEDLEIIYRRFDKNVISKEKIAEYEPTRLKYGGGTIVGGNVCLMGLHILNVFQEEPVRSIELTIYNAGAYFASGRQNLDGRKTYYKLCDSYTADVSSDVLGTMYMIYQLQDCRPVVENAKEASIADKAIIQADITYKDGSTKTEYLGLGSYQGMHCNWMEMYRLEVEE